MKQHTNMTLYSYRKREESKEEEESVMKHSRVLIAGDNVNAVMVHVTHPPIPMRVLRTTTSD